MQTRRISSFTGSPFWMEDMCDYKCKLDQPAISCQHGKEKKSDLPVQIWDPALHCMNRIRVNIPHSHTNKSIWSVKDFVTTRKGMLCDFATDSVISKVTLGSTFGHAWGQGILTSFTHGCRPAQHHNGGLPVVFSNVSTQADRILSRRRWMFAQLTSAHQQSHLSGFPPPYMAKEPPPLAVQRPSSFLALPCCCPAYLPKLWHRCLFFVIAWCWLLERDVVRQEKSMSEDIVFVVLCCVPVAWGWKWYVTRPGVLPS